MLRKIRIILGAITLLLLTFLFVDFAGLLPAEQIPLAEIQFFPALLSMSLGTVVALLILTLIFGRVYCSVICPLGIFQDLIDRISRLFKKRKKYGFSPEKKVWRYGILVLALGTWIAGWTVIVSLLDPYGAFGRMATHLLRPIYIEGNNLLASLFNHFGNYSFYQTDVFLLSVSSLIVALLTFFIVGYLAWRYGRTCCNTVCPVGTILGLVSRYSMFRFQVHEENCNNCGLCALKCKASCIDSKKGVVDGSRCVTCFNCTEVCKQQALKYEFAWVRKSSGNPLTKSSDSVKSDLSSVEQNKSSMEAFSNQSVSPSRRRFLGTLGVTILAAGSHVWAQNMHIKTNKPWSRKNPLSPPGSHAVGHLNAHCTACHLCVAQCPSKVLKPSFLEYGPGGMMQPVMDFTHGFCNYDCTRCSHVCPNGALRPLTKEEKHATQMGYVVFVKTNCVVYTDETYCGACSEHCPTQAVSMVPYKNGLTIPQVNTDICVGCGGCEYVCPAKPAKAIYVEGNPVHKVARAFEDKGSQDVNLEGFGF
jgi:polyferredoxin